MLQPSRCVTQVQRRFNTLCVLMGCRSGARSTCCALLYMCCCGAACGMPHPHLRMQHPRSVGAYSIAVLVSIFTCMHTRACNHHPHHAHGRCPFFFPLACVPRTGFGDGSFYRRPTTTGCCAAFDPTACRAPTGYARVGRLRHGCPTTSRSNVGAAKICQRAHRCAWSWLCWLVGWLVLSALCVVCAYPVPSAQCLVCRASCYRQGTHSTAKPNTTSDTHSTSPHLCPQAPLSCLQG